MASEELVDRDIRQRIWQGTVPVAVELSSNEVTTLEKPRPFYVRRARIQILITFPSQNIPLFHCKIPFSAPKYDAEQS
jgi:hypothetical protein